MFPFWLLASASGFFAFLLLDRFSANLFPAALPRQCLLNAFSLARFQVEGVFLHFLNDVFLLNLALEASQRILDGLAILNSNFGQINTPPIRLRSIPIISTPLNQSQTGFDIYCCAYGTLSFVFCKIRQAVLSGQGSANLCGLLRHEA